MISRVFLYIDRIFSIVRPRRLLYMAIGMQNRFASAPSDFFSSSERVLCAQMVLLLVPK
jgi:hypothetical protein